MTEKKIAVPQEGGSYLVDKKGNVVRQEHTVQAHDPAHPDNQPAPSPAPETPVKDA